MPGLDALSTQLADRGLGSAGYYAMGQDQNLAIVCIIGLVLANQGCGGQVGTIQVLYHRTQFILGIICIAQMHGRAVHTGNAFLPHENFLFHRGQAAQFRIVQGNRFPHLGLIAVA